MHAGPNGGPSRAAEVHPMPSSTPDSTDLPPSEAAQRREPAPGT